MQFEAFFFSPSVFNKVFTPKASADLFESLVQKNPGLLAQPLSRVQISTMAVKEGLMVAGGFQGELICKVWGFAKCTFINVASLILSLFSNYCSIPVGQNLNHPGVAFCTKLTTDENAITNAVDIYRNPR